MPDIFIIYEMEEICMQFRRSSRCERLKSYTQTQTHAHTITYRLTSLVPHKFHSKMWFLFIFDVHAKMAMARPNMFAKRITQAICKELKVKGIKSMHKCHKIPITATAEAFIVFDAI